EAGLVLHARAAFYEIAKVDIGDVKLLGPLNDLEDVPGAQGPMTLIGVMEKIDRRQSAWKRIHIPDADQSVAEMIAPFLGSERIFHEGMRIARHIFRFVTWPAFGFGLHVMIAVVEIQLSARDAR